ncbi:MAG: TMEM143 family protein [Gemmataceae bacterium]|nr:TMEM143 family protein [Gemmataceae bacterium]
MAEYLDREHFLPIRKSDLVDHLCRRHPLGGRPLLTAEEQHKFRRFCDIAAAYLHHLYHQRLDSLKDLYSPFDPDRDTILTRELTPEQRAERLEKLYQQFHDLLTSANFRHLSREEMQQATRDVSLWGINLDIDFDCFDRLEVYYRGSGNSTRPRRVWYKPWIVEDIPVRVYQRLVLLIKQRPHKRLGKHPDTNNVFLNLFKDIPTVDVEMLFPGGRLKMPSWEKSKLGASMASAVGFGAWKIYSDFAHLITGAATFLQQNPLSLYGPLSIVLGYGYKQYYAYQVTRRQYAHRLTESLYYQSLDSNAGVLSRLLDEAEEQECREVFLAYFHLWRDAPEEGWTAEQLDDFIEIDLERTLKLKVDFEIADALAKLERLQLVESRDSDRFVAVPIDEAMRRIDEVWDNIFPYHQEATP